jgi:hypothetical protein
LATCVFFGSITGAHAEGSDYVPGSLAPADVSVLASLLISPSKD